MDCAFRVQLALVAVDFGRENAREREKINSGSMRTTERPSRPVFARPREWLGNLPIAAPFRRWLPQTGEAALRLPALWQAPTRLPRVLRTTPSGGGRWIFFILALLPTILAVLYFGFIATDRYVAVAQFVVRTAAKPNGLSGLGSLLHMAGLSNSDDDTYAVQNYMTSLDAVQQLEQKLPLREYYGRPEADFIARYPSLFYGTSLEQFYDYLQWMISVVYVPATGITTIRVEAFRPEDAQAIALALLDLGEQLVNRMNERIYNDAVSVAADEVNHDQQRLVAAELDLTSFRNKEMMIDPDRSSLIVTELIARLESEVSQTKAQLTALTASSPNSPQLGILRERITALQAQILQQRSQISDQSTGLARKLAVYEQLSLQRKFAENILATASSRLETARVEAQRQQLYLDRIVEPSKADYPMAPESLRMVATVFGLNILGILVAWLVSAGIKEHAAVHD